MNNVLIGILGSRLDHGGLGQRRFERWRPSISLLMHPGLPIHEYILMYLPEDQQLLDLTVHDITLLSPNTKVTTVPINCEDAWDFEQVYNQIHTVATNLSFDVDANNYFVSITTGTHVAQICLYLLTESHYFPGKLIQSSPTEDGPQGTYQVIDLDLSRYDQIAERFAKESSDAIDYLKSGIQTRNKAFNSLIAQIEHVSIKSSAPILLQGPTGAGKSQLAKRIYELKKQRGQFKGNMVEVNCATLRGDNAMSALFGHVKGAFTGAVNARPGLLLEANNGFLFLDEIGELGLDEQAMLLRAIEDKCFTPFGGDKPIKSDFQLIAGTHQDLFERVTQGLFREDLLARINLWTYELPSLRDRIEDLEPNLNHELQKFAKNAGHKVSFNKDAREKYMDFSYSARAIWRANFRDLNSSVVRMGTLATGGRITVDIVDGEIARLEKSWSAFAPVKSEQADLIRDYLSPSQIDELDLFDRLQLNEVLRVCRNSQSLAEAGRTLFNASRERKASSNDSHRVKQYLNKFGLQFEQIKKP